MTLAAKGSPQCDGYAIKLNTKHVDAKAWTRILNNIDREDMKPDRVFKLCCVRFAPRIMLTTSTNLIYYN